MTAAPATPSLHLVLLEFADPSRAGDHMEAHNAWIDTGFADGVFLMTGTMPGRGGTVLVKAGTTAEVDERVQQDPFVAHGVVTPQVIEVVPSRVAPDLQGALG